MKDIDSWHTSLKSDGYAVICNFLPDENRQELLDLFYENFFTAARQSDDLNLKKMTRENKQSWMSPDQLGRKSRHAPLHIAQSDFMWGLRVHPNVSKVFSQLHSVDHPTDLVTSLDSYSLQMRGHPSEGLVLHDDQAWGYDDRSELYSIQGAYNFYSCNVDDTGLMIVPKSHQKWHKRRAGTIGSRHNRHFVPITPDEDDYAKSYAQARKLILPKNCFVIWNSKLLHGTCVGTRERNNENEHHCEATSSVLPEPVPETSTPISSSGGENGADSKEVEYGLPRVNRLTCFVSMAPKQFRSPEALTSKIQIYKSGGTTSHWSTHAESHTLNEKGPIGGFVDENGNIPEERLALL